MTFEEYLSSLKGKTVGVIGVGVSNRPLIEKLLERGIDVTARDKKEDLGELGQAQATPGAAGQALGPEAPAPIPVLLRIEFTAMDALTHHRVSSYLAFPPLPRRCQLHSFRPAANGRPKSLRCTLSPHKN